MLSINRPEAYLTRMLEREINQQEVADLHGVTRQTYSNRCRNGTMTSTDFSAIAQHFGVNLVGLLNWCGVIDIADVRDFMDLVEGRVPSGEGRSASAAAVLTQPTTATTTAKQVGKRQREVFIRGTHAY
jgi:hypothetical protein